MIRAQRIIVTLTMK